MMEENRHAHLTRSKTPLSEKVTVPAYYWEDLGQRDLEEICKAGMASVHSPEGYLILPFLQESLLVDTRERSLKRRKKGEWERLDYPLLELLTLVYLLRTSPDPLNGEMVSCQQLKTSHFFRGPHALDFTLLMERYGYDIAGFRKAAESLGGAAEKLADMAYRILTFPKVPLYYLLWEGDEEFAPRLSVLFDKSIERHLPADAIWGLVNLVSDLLLRSPENPLR